MKRLPWLKPHEKTDPALPLEPPLWFGHRSNGESVRSATDRDRKVRSAILVRADENARRLGIPRRDFLAGAMGMATSLLVLNAFVAHSRDCMRLGRPG